MKYSQSTPPQFPHPEGSFCVDYRDHNGRFFLGSGDWTFETSWSTGGNGVIHVMNDPNGIKGVAVAPGVSMIEEVTETVVSSANFTSRVRTPRSGQVVLFENSSGYLAAVELGEITVSPEGEPGTAIKGRYRILTDRSRSFVSAKMEPIIHLRASIADALTALVELEPQPPVEYKSLEIGIGHNNPPSDAAIDLIDYSQTVVLLTSLDSEAAEGIVTQTAIDKTRGWLGTVISKISRWVQHRAKLVEEGFYRQLGAASALAMIGLSIWAGVAGKLEAVLTAIQSLLS
jgi:hypothetical protein